MSSKEKEKESPLKVAGYVVGSIALGAIAVMVIPELLNKGASSYYKIANKPKNYSDDTEDVLVRKKSNKDV